MKAEDLKIKCPECGYKDFAKITTTYEQDDRDGNRGINITWYECYNCGADLREAIEEVI